MNKVILIGNLGSDPELRYTTAGKPVCNLAVATSSFSGGEQRTEWHKVTLWGKAAENAQKHLGRGSKIGLEGALKTRRWERNGVTFHTTEIHTNFVEYLSRAIRQNEVPEFPHPDNEDPGPQQEKPEGWDEDGAPL